MKELLIPRSKISLAEDVGFCIYTLYLGSVAIYVGQSSSLLSRLKTHDKTKTFDSFSFIDVAVEDMDEVETKLIIERQPTMNKRLPSNTSYVNVDTAVKAIGLLVKDELMGHSVFTGKESQYTKTKCTYIEAGLIDTIDKAIKSAIKKEINNEPITNTPSN